LVEHYPVKQLFASGHAVDIVLAVLALEGLILVARKRNMAEVCLMLFPAALILLGLRAALVGAPWPMIAIPLALSFPVHLADLRLRLGRSRGVRD
jgi:hypothetical protein